MAAFKLGINMAGAISAGAYTAGVLDFLTEALDTWYEAKQNEELVPLHEISLEVFSGASAGGMCAAISAVMLGQAFDHIADTSRTGTSNRFYESWVNQIDIRKLLRTTDLKRGSKRVVSLLDSSIIEEIATYALQPGKALEKPREYVSKRLTLFLSLTNLRGVPYSLNGAAPGSVEETTFFYGDRMCFETRTTGDQAKPRSPAVHLLPLDQPEAASWKTLQTAAMATGAFPVFLAPRVLDRACDEYTPPMWESVASKLEGTPPWIKPNFPGDLKEPMQTLNVDGGITNNDPFNYAHDYLASLEPAQDPASTAHDALSTDRAVISIAPFPTTERFAAVYDAEANSGIFSALPSLFAALVSQSRFFGESLSKVMDGTTFNRFVIAPSSDAVAHKEPHQSGSQGKRRQRPALQCASLGAFGGFFARGFRAHDYALGRRNCQKFLSDSFVLPAGNPIMRAALETMDEDRRSEVMRIFGKSAPLTYAPQADRSARTSQESRGTVPVAASLVATKSDPYAECWLPLIPLVGRKLTDEVPEMERQTISSGELKLIVKLIRKRFRAVMSVLLNSVSPWKLRVFLRAGQPLIARLASPPLKRALICQLGDDYKS